jgi:hypothetical protein
LVGTAHPDENRVVRVLISGSRGLIGSALVPRLESDGHVVVRLVRGPSEPGTATWDPAHGQLDPVVLGGVDAVVHLSGEGIATHRWSPAHKGRVLHSRVDSTTLLARTLVGLPNRPAVLLSASAIGYYGDRGDDELTEDAGPGTGFLADLCQAWEAATAAAEEAGIRVVRLRTGIVLCRSGGALAKQLPLFRLGVGGRLGSGRQQTSWISIDDEVGAIAFALARPGLRGPVNLTAPFPVSNAEFSATLARAVHRPAVLPVPAFALRAALGRQMADEMVLSGARVVPARLQAAGYTFAHPNLDEALASVLARP